LLVQSPLQSNELPPVLPPLSVYETPDEIIIEVQMAGVAKEGLHVECRGRVVFVTGERRQTPRAGGRFLVVEQSLGPYQRIIPLPAETSSSDLAAHISDGLLELRIRKRDVTQETRDIPVR
jgi:HSP20 family protein